MSKVIPLASSDKGIISITKIDEPYGEGSKPVVSIGISLNGDADKPDWKAHIPLENVDEVCAAVKEVANS
ncbi:hypothetical protein MNB_SM-7-180 [hydrothermal vent metagenome]|uniref:Uncharacterized protein n=1 Tax=hydrothermal vent metagenome TaxID=652676 RepID=A0A1W1BZS2_9ZZZZ